MFVGPQHTKEQKKLKTRELESQDATKITSAPAESCIRCLWPAMPILMTALVRQTIRRSSSTLARSPSSLKEMAMSSALVAAARSDSCESLLSVYVGPICMSLNDFSCKCEGVPLFRISEKRCLVHPHHYEHHNDSKGRLCGQEIAGAFALFVPTGRTTSATRPLLVPISLTDSPHPF